MAQRGRPKHTDRGTQRLPFNWRGPIGINPTTQYCTVTWMRHGQRVAAAAMYRSLGGIDVTYLGMAHGEINGWLQAIGDSKQHQVRALLGRPPLRERDWIEAVQLLAVTSLEEACELALDSGKDADGEHPWQAMGKAECEAHRHARRQAAKAGTA